MWWRVGVDQFVVDGGQLAGVDVDRALLGTEGPRPVVVGVELDHDGAGGVHLRVARELGRLVVGLGEESCSR